LRVEAGLDRLDQNFAELNRIMVRLSFSIVGAMIAAFVALAAAILQM
jgi:hypothetical protein